MKTIDELWYGNVSPFEQCTRGDKRLKELLKTNTKRKGIAMKKKIQEHYRIISLDGSDVYKLSHPSDMYGKLTAMKDGETDYSKFNATLDVSLDTQKLAEIYPKHESEMGVPFLDELEYMRAIVNVSFDYAVKLFEQSSNRFIRFGHSVADEDVHDHVCIREVDGVPTGVFNLFYYASRIIDEDAEDMYPHPAFADVDMRAKKEDRAKRMGLTMGGM